MNKINSMLIALVMVMGVFAPLISADTVTTEAVLGFGGTDPVLNATFVLDPDGNCQVTPNPGTGNTEVLTEFYKYAIVSDPLGINNIATVYEQLRDPNGNPISLEVEMDDITGTGEVNTVLDDALACSLITQDEYDDYVWGLDPLKAQFKMYKVQNELDNHAEPGSYEVYFKVVNGFSGFSEGTCTFNYLGINAMEIDFNVVDYGPIQIGVEKWAAGDDTFDPSGTSDKPTVKNQGNINIKFKVQGTELLGLNSPQQTIPASALSVEFFGQHVHDLTDWVTLDGQLTPCTPKQISFDINAPSGSSANTYEGSLSILSVVA